MKDAAGAPYNNFPYKDVNNNNLPIPRNVLAFVHPDFINTNMCVSNIDCEDSTQWHTKFAGHGVFGGGGGYLYSSNTTPIPSPPSVPGTDNARYIADATLPDGTAVSPGQSLPKVWTVNNTGTRAWNADYRLVFIGGISLGAPESVSVPTAAPGQRVNLTVPLNIPTTLGPGTYTGRWKMRNAQGTFFGDEIWFKLQIGNTQPPGGNGAAAEVITISDSPSTVSPGQTFRPAITVRVNKGQLRQDRGDMLRFTGGTNYSGFPHITVQGTINSGQTTTFRFYSDHPIVAPNADGTYEMRWKVWANGGFVGDELVIRFTVSRFPTGRPPHRPVLTSPDDWAVIVGQPPQLCAQHQGDPDGDSITDYRFAIIDSANLWDSGWVSSSCATPTNIGNYGYQWYAKVRDARGVESDWSERRRFNLESSTVTINEFYFQPPSPSNVETVIIRAGTTGCGGIGVGLKALVNSATDGSASGEWRTIKELGVPHFNAEDAPRWETLEYPEGIHRVPRAAMAPKCIRSSCIHCSAANQAVPTCRVLRILFGLAAEPSHLPGRALCGQLTIP